MFISRLNNGLGLPVNSDQTNQNGRVSAAFFPASLVAQHHRQFVEQQDQTSVSTGTSLQIPVVPPRNQFQPAVMPPRNQFQPVMNMNTNFHALSALAFHQPTSCFPPLLATTPFINDPSSFTNLHRNEMRIRFQHQQQNQQNQLFQLHQNQNSMHHQQINNLMLQSANIASASSSARDHSYSGCVDFGRLHVNGQKQERRRKRN